MSNRLFVTLVLVLGVGGGASCTRVDGPSQKDESEAPSRAGTRASRVQAESEEPEEERAAAGRASEAGRGGNASLRSAAQGGRGGAGGSGGSGRPEVPEKQPEIAAASANECGFSMLAPAPLCLDTDPAEPNDESHPIKLPIEPNCGYVEANISKDDEDYYSFSSSKSEPILIEVSYVAEGESDLEHAVYGSTGNHLASESVTRMGPGEDQSSAIHATAGGTYTVRVRDTKGAKSCQRYALRVNPLYCTDEYEDNDDAETSAKLRWDANERVSVQGTLLERDDDYFELITERADPVLLVGSYTAPANSTVQVTRTFYDGAGTVRSSVSGSRKTDSEMFQHWLPAPSKNSVLRTRLYASGLGCASYDLSYDAAACTDEFEDNDRTTEAAKLASATEVAATIHSTDEDHYALSGIKTGSCTVIYDIPTGQTQQMSLSVYDGAGTSVASRSGGDLSGTTRTLRASWTDREGVTIKLTANTGGYCQPYRLRCDPAEGQ